MSRRDDILEELGLAPVWRLRTPADEAPALEEEPPAAEAPVTGHRSPVTPQQEPVTGHRSPVTAREAPAGSRAARGEGYQSPITNHQSRPSELREEHQSPVTGHQSRPSDAGDRRETIALLDWPELKSRVASCTDCPLHARRTKTVFGVGDENADWLFVGEGPGADEDAQGEPFVGQAGKLLDNMLAAIKMKRGENVFIANIVKCRPPGNRNPEAAEASACEPYLQRQIGLIKPKLIIALGKVAAQNLLGREASIASLRGKVHRYGEIPLIITYHPAYLLRSLTEKAKAWEDLCFAVRTMADLGKA